MRVVLILLIAFSSCCWCLIAPFPINAQVPTGANAAPTVSPQPSPSTFPKGEAESVQSQDDLPRALYGGPIYISQPEFYLSLIIAGLGLATLIMEYALLRKNPKLKAEEALRIFGVTVILIGALIATVAGYSSRDIAPAIGLFGTVAGYLLGKSNGKNEGRKHDDV